MHHDEPLFVAFVASITLRITIKHNDVLTYTTGAVSSSMPIAVLGSIALLMIYRAPNTTVC
jgi:hypothetical protein